VRRVHTRDHEQAEHIIIIIIICVCSGRRVAACAIRSDVSPRTTGIMCAPNIRVPNKIIYFFILRSRLSSTRFHSVNAFEDTDNVPTTVTIMIMMIMIIIITIIIMYGRTLLRARTRPLNERQTRTFDPSRDVKSL